MFVRSSLVVMALVATVMLHIRDTECKNGPVKPEFDLLINLEFNGTITFYGYSVGRFQIYNNWTNEILVNEVTHRMVDKNMKGHSTTIRDIRIPPFSNSSVQKFIYESNKLANDYDQWSITALINGVGKYTSSRVCDVVKFDSNCDIISLIVDPLASNFVVRQSASLQCTEPLSPYEWKPSSP